MQPKNYTAGARDTLPGDGDHFSQYGMRSNAQSGRGREQDARRFGQAGYGGYQGEFGDERSFGAEGVDYDEEYRLREARNPRPRSLPTGGAGEERVSSGNGRPFDPDYHQWRGEQMRQMDAEYEEWRRERYQRFSSEFDQWRSQRTAGQDQRGDGAAQAGADDRVPAVGSRTQDADPSSVRPARGGAQHR